MSLVISGNAAHVTTPLTATVVGMADNGSGAIRVQTSAPHHFATDDFVHVITITTVINAYFTITTIDATHFDLVGSTFTGTGTGTATDASLTPQIQVPTDGDTFSLQLSGMLSALQALADRTQFLRKTAVQKTAMAVVVTASGQVVVPPSATHMILFGCGGGGGGGGAPGGVANDASVQCGAGGGGGGAQFNFQFATVASATRLDVVIGAGGAGGSGTAGGAPSPSDAGPGIRGNPTTIAYNDGFFAGFTFATFHGGPGGGKGCFTEITAFTGNVPVFTPGGGRGPGGFFRNGSTSKRSQTAPGIQQVYNLYNSAGVVTVVSGAWATRVYTDPVGQMTYGEGGASMATAQNPTYAAGVSYGGAPSLNGNAGGGAGTEGTPDTVWTGGAAGGGGGGGGFGLGGNGGNGGNGSSGILATAGTAGANGSTNSGAGGGGGGGGGNGNGAAGAGAAGGNGGSGAVWIIFLTAPAVP